MKNSEAYSGSKDVQRQAEKPLYDSSYDAQIFGETQSPQP